MEIDQGIVVTLRYELRNRDEHGELMERMDAKYPFQFLFGTGKLLPSFEKEIKGLKDGDEFEFILPAEDAYGYPKQEEIVNVPISAFYVDGRIPDQLVEKGNQVTLTDDHGRNHTGKILDFDKEKVKVDFNHVMVGKDLHFKGQVLNLRKANVDELARNHHIPDA
jgi:FKBP-type peptidyl-prolyl cis-trans isomerase SlyD